MIELVMNMKKRQPLQQGNYFNHMKLEEVTTTWNIKRENLIERLGIQ